MQKFFYEDKQTARTALQHALFVYFQPLQIFFHHGKVMGQMTAAKITISR